MAQAFFGGVHPHDMKAATNEKAIEQLPAPAQVVIPMSQHFGAPCTPLVKAGDHVKVGQKIGEFRGLVYVAPDAQRTDARQQSRNILLSETARIDAKPQLEIYADDVKCSHGATVGQMDADAILYMRQRGLSLAQARRLQIEGFAGDVVRRCGIGELGEALMEAVARKMETM